MFNGLVIILLLFCLSGATALVYEVVWSRYMMLLFGSTVQAQTVVLAIFMGGMGLGSLLFGRWTRTLKNPVVVYGLIELAIGLYGFCFEIFHEQADLFFIRTGQSLLEHPHLLLFLKMGMSAGLLLAPTFLMGGTLPMLAAWIQKKFEDPGRWAALFYSVNTLGAVGGASLAGFFLTPMLGMSMTLWFTASVNLIIGIAAILFAGQESNRSETAGPLSASQQEGVCPPPLPSDSRCGRRNSPSHAIPHINLLRGCFLVALTGGISMSLEVLASRFLSLLFGASLPSFAAMLMAFILGIGLGSAAVSSPKIRRPHAEAIIATLLLATSFLLGILMLGIETWAKLYCLVNSGLAHNEMGYRYHVLLTVLISLAVLGLPAGLLGAVLPVCMRQTGDDVFGLGKRIGRLLAWNTLGAVAGAIFTGFVLMPKAGLRGSMGFLAILLSFAPLFLAWKKQWLPLFPIPIIFSLALGFLTFTGGESWRLVVSSGIFRLHDATTGVDYLANRRKNAKILFYEDAADATVSVEKGCNKNKEELSLRINGKPDASTQGDLSTQYLLAHLPMLGRPGSKDAFVLGFGSGITAGALLGHPLGRIVIAENCEPVLRAGRFFSTWNRQAPEQPRVRIYVEDARTVLKLNPQKYDIIISEPSNPWMAGIGSVFSREFYELAASRLKEGGIMAQWFHIYEMNDEIAALILRTFRSVFPHMEIWDSQEGDIILLGSKKPWDSGPAFFKKVFERPLPRQDLQSIGLHTPESVWARQLASQRTAFAIVGSGMVQSDERPILEQNAPRAFYIGTLSQFLTPFDERTHQSEIAPPYKRKTLAALDDATLKNIFRKSSINPEIMNYLFRRLGRRPQFPADSVEIPCIFDPSLQKKRVPETPEGSNDLLKRLLLAEDMIRSDPSKAAEGIQIITTILQEDILSQKNTDLVPSPVYFASVAIRNSLCRGDVLQASRLLKLGLKHNPYSPQLAYYGRILERESRPQ
ncbi:MAG: fused MFS/spermidine synthase [Verrucomicrobiae bacterium]|nr:fused MFS/spermidine synthase [Verrucomicrobiae bacterium]